MCSTYDGSTYDFQLNKGMKVIYIQLKLYLEFSILIFSGASAMPCNILVMLGSGSKVICPAVG